MCHKWIASLRAHAYYVIIGIMRVFFCSALAFLALSVASYRVSHDKHRFNSLITNGRKFPLRLNSVSNIGNSTCLYIRSFGYVILINFWLKVFVWSQPSILLMVLLFFYASLANMIILYRIWLSQWICQWSCRVHSEKLLMGEHQEHLQLSFKYFRLCGFGIEFICNFIFCNIWFRIQRTAINYQYRYGTTISESLSRLYSEGGIARLYQGFPFAAVQSPLARHEQIRFSYLYTVVYTCHISLVNKKYKWLFIALYLFWMPLDSAILQRTH